MFGGRRELHIRRLKQLAASSRINLLCSFVLNSTSRQLIPAYSSQVRDFPREGTFVDCL
jgi:hypothetical protein